MSSTIAWLVAFVVLSFAFVGCGSNALKMNANVARVMLEVQAESGPVIRELRVDASVESARQVHESGGDEEAARAAATRTANRWQCAIDSHRIYQSAVGAYIDSLALWYVGDDFNWTDAIPYVVRVLDMYRALVSCLRSLGSSALPAVPAFLDLIPSTWGVASDG